MEQACSLSVVVNRARNLAIVRALSKRIKCNRTFCTFTDRPHYMGLVDVKLLPVQIPNAGIVDIPQHYERPYKSWDGSPTAPGFFPGSPEEKAALSFFEDIWYECIVSDIPMHIKKLSANNWCSLVFENPTDALIFKLTI